MNIFILDRDPASAAACHADIHLAKMILEGAQMLAAAFHHYGHPVEYKPTHINHPCSRWVRESRDNALWLYCLMEFLEIERQLRFGTKPRHKSLLLAEKWMEHIALLPSKGLTEFVLAMPDQYRSADPVGSYRAYYASKAATMPLRYSNTSAPKWITLPERTPT